MNVMCCVKCRELRIVVSRRKKSVCELEEMFKSNRITCLHLSFCPAGHDAAKCSYSFQPVSMPIHTRRLYLPYPIRIYPVALVRYLCLANDVIASVFWPNHNTEMSVVQLFF